MRVTKVEGFVVKFAKAAYLGGRAEDAAGRRIAGDYVRHQTYRSVYSTRTETFLVRITAEDGSFGWGEAQAPILPEAVGTVVERLLGPLLLGRDVLDTSVLWAQGYDSMRERGHFGGFQVDAMAACDIALWDLKGKALGASVSELLGGRFRDHVPCYVSGLHATDPAERGRLARSWQERGFDAFKLALGDGVDADAMTVGIVREAVGGSTPVHVDAHWVYTVPEAIALGTELQSLGPGFLEAPLAPEDNRGYAEVARALTAPVAMGEELRTRYAFTDVLVARAADVLQPDVGRTGISEAAAIATVAESFHVPVALHLGVGLAPYIAASIHVAAAIPNLLTMEYQPGLFKMANRLLESPMECAEGAYAVPDGPGLGVDVSLEEVIAQATSSFTVDQAAVSAP